MYSNLPPLLIEIGTKAKASARISSALTTDEKNAALNACADALIKNTPEILAANAYDLEQLAFGDSRNSKPSFVDRLTLNEKRIEEIAEGLLQVATLEDPVDTRNPLYEQRTLPNGLVVGKRRVPLGVIGIIYEARPNVTADAFGLCFKTGNAVILRGGKEAITTNKAIVTVLRDTLNSVGINPDVLQLIEDTARETATAFMCMNGYLDVLIPRGGAGLIKSVMENSSVPVIETGTGNCHIYVDKSADLKMATEILVNAKTQRPSVCNACETLLIHKDIATDFLPAICDALNQHGVEIRGDVLTCELVTYAKPVTDEDYATEFLDLIISVKTVSNVEEAVNHITMYSTGHSEAIITGDNKSAEYFTNTVDAAAVYVNASTRFTDGFEFGMGAEIGISTQKLHARGPMGLTELTSYKYIINGNGQIRA